MKTSPTMMKSVSKNSIKRYIIKHGMDSDFMNVGVTVTGGTLKTWNGL